MPSKKPISARARTKRGARVCFRATLLRPAGKCAGAPWLFLNLPKTASAKLPSRGQVTVEGTLDGAPLLATLEPDGRGGHWLKVEKKLLAGDMTAGDAVTLDVTPVPPEREPEPAVPPDLRAALARAPKARAVWEDITPSARRDWIKWVTSGKRAETRALRIGKACDMLASGKRRACCFDRSGMYDQSLNCPIAESP